MSDKQLKIMEAAAQLVPGASFEYPGYIVVVEGDRVYSFGTATGDYGYDVTDSSGDVTGGDETISASVSAGRLASFIARVVHGTKKAGPNSRAALAAWASRAFPGAPKLKANATLDQLLDWNQRNDPNGEWSNIREHLERTRGGKTWKQHDDELYPDLPHTYDEDEVEVPSIDVLWDMIETARDENA